MRPSDARLDARDGAVRDAVLIRNLLLFTGVGSNGSHLFKRQLGRSAPLASIAGAVLNPVKDVGLMRIPAQVINVVVCWVAIVVAPLHSLGAWAFEGVQDKAMHLHQLLLPVAPKVDAKAPIIRPAVALDAATDGSHPTVVGNLVMALKPCDWLPLFHASHCAHNQTMVQVC